MLNQKSNTITVEVRRIGGGLEKKRNLLYLQQFVLLQKKTKRPVKLRVDRDDEIIITGKRHDFSNMKWVLMNWELYRVKN